MAYTGRNEKGEWGLALGSAAQGSLIDLVGVSFFPLYKVVGPMIFFLSLLLLVWGGLRLIITIFLRIVIIVRYKGCGIWVLTAFWETLFQLAVSSFNWIDAAMKDVGMKVGQMMETEAAREADKEETEKWSLEDLWRKYSWWPSSHRREGASSPHQNLGAEDEDNASSGESINVINVKVMTTSQGECSELSEVGVVMSS